MDSGTGFYIGNDRSKFINMCLYFGSFGGVGGIIPIIRYNNIILYYKSNKSNINFTIKNTCYTLECPITLLNLWQIINMFNTRIIIDSISFFFITSDTVITTTTGFSNLWKFDLTDTSVNKIFVSIIYRLAALSMSFFNIIL